MVLSKKIYTTFLMLFLVSTSEANTHATTVDACLKWLQAFDGTSSGPEPVQPSANKEYQKFMRARAANPNLKPLTLTFEREPSETDLRENFFLWWYPGNVFGPLMVPKFEELAAHILAGGEIEPGMVPTAADLATEARTRAEQPIKIDLRRVAVQKTVEKKMNQLNRKGMAARHDEIYEDRDSTKDNAMTTSLAQGAIGGPDAADPGSGVFSDTSTPSTDSH